MKLLRSIIAASMILCAATTGAAGETAKQQAIRYYAHLNAILMVCPNAVVDYVPVATIARKEGVYLDKDRDAINALFGPEVQRLKKAGEQAACAEGLRLYGPEGLYVPGSMKLP